MLPKSILLFAILLSPVSAILFFKPKTSYQQPSNLVRAYSNPENIETVETYDDVKVSHLKKYGMIRILDDNSIIVSETLGQRMLQQDYKGSFDPQRQYDEGNDDKKVDYVQIRFKHMKTSRKDNIWANLGGCRENLSSQPANYKQGWSIDSSLGITTSFKFPLLFGVKLTFGSDVTIGQSISGELSCDVGPHENLMFQIMAQDIVIEGVQIRKLKLGFTELRLHAQGWKEVPKFTMVNKNSVQVACRAGKNLVCPKAIQQIDDANANIHVSEGPQTLDQTTVNDNTFVQVIEPTFTGYFNTTTLTTLYM
ncbi:uncharacterized protein RJT21DRAFT_121174 [Scheffersomyces amazonensis]|uniref:uncharacterized protein n=1 Tax=Scheffersomyces amazonensis TaxID=1078765 RepID=UPI00315DAB3B